MWSPAYCLYNIVASVAVPLAAGAAVFKGRLKGKWKERFGFTPLKGNASSPRVWIHAASVGEVQVAGALAVALGRESRDLEIMVSTMTDTGRVAAREGLSPEYQVVMFPLDAFGGPARALRRLKPDLVIILETELWPNFLRSAGLSGVKIMLANGRISERSFAGYRRVKFLFREVVGFLDLMAMIRPEDRDRIIALGAPADKVTVAGNAKFDLLVNRVDPSAAERLGRELGIGNRPVLVAGSTRKGEEPLLLEAYRRLLGDFPDLHLILAPRHVQRANEIEGLIKAGNMTCLRRSRREKAVDIPNAVTLVDVMGELFYLYGLADAAFVGASLVHRGGQNPLEAAVWSKPVVYGPHMDDFLDARDWLDAAGAGFTVSGPEDLYRTFKKLLEEPQLAARAGAAGRAALDGRLGASGRLAAMALELLETRKKCS